MSIKFALLYSSDVTSMDDVRGPICLGYVTYTQRDNRYSLTSINGAETDRLLEESKLHKIEEYKQ